jgi:hypothetical protein
MLKPIPKWLAYTVGTIALVNFVAFVLIADLIGGDALNGHAAHGHYFLAYHRQLTEVSRATYLYSVFHTLSVFVTHGLAIFVGWKWTQQKKASQP